MKFLLKFSLFILLFSVCANAKTRAKSCDLQLNIHDFLGKESVETPNASLKNATGDIIFAQPLDGKLIFPRIAEGAYLLSAWSKNHKTSVKILKINCGEVGNESVVFKSIYLLKGDSNEKIHIIDKDHSRLEENQFGTQQVLALNLSKPNYPKEARKAKASGRVEVVVKIDGSGKVLSAEAISGDSLLWKSAEEAALNSLFIPSVLEGEPVAVTGTIVYNFNP